MASPDLLSKVKPVSEISTTVTTPIQIDTRGEQKFVMTPGLKMKTAMAELIAKMRGAGPGRFLHVRPNAMRITTIITK